MTPRDPLSRFLVWASVLLALGPVSFIAIPIDALESSLSVVLGGLLLLAPVAFIAALGLGVSLWVFNAAMEYVSWELPGGLSLSAFLWTRFISSAAIAWGGLAWVGDINLFDPFLATVLPLPAWMLFTFVLGVEPYLDTMVRRTMASDG